MKNFNSESTGIFEFKNKTEIPEAKRRKIWENVGVSYTLTPPAINEVIGFPVQRMPEIVKAVGRKNMPVEYIIGFGSKQEDQKFLRLCRKKKISPYSFHSYKLPALPQRGLKSRMADLVLYRRPEHRVVFRELADMIKTAGAEVGVVHMAEAVDAVINEGDESIFKYLEQLQYDERGYKKFDICLETSDEYREVWAKMRHKPAIAAKYADLIYTARSPLLLAEKIKDDNLDLKLTIDLQHWITSCLGKTPNKTKEERFQQFKKEWEELVNLSAGNINKFVGHVHINSAARENWEKDAHGSVIESEEIKFFLLELADKGYNRKTIIELEPLSMRAMVMTADLQQETKALWQSYGSD